MGDGVFQAFSQNGEDVILWRALHDVTNGRYIDVGANDPSFFSITKAFYDHGWRGITVEPSHHYAQMHRDQRPGDIVVEAAVASKGTSVTLHEIDGSGLSTLVDDVRDRHASQGWQVHEVEVPTKTLDLILDEANWSGLDIHFMTVDVEGAEGDVLASIDLTRWRPWILVIESTAPLTTDQTHGPWEPLLLAADYQFCLFDGLSRYYVSAERAEQLAHDLSYGPSVFDSYESASQRDVLRRLDAATDDSVRWRTQARQAAERCDELEHRLAALQGSVSWRLTAPLRTARRSLGRVARATRRHRDPA